MLFFFTPVLELSKACFKISSIHCMKGAFARVSGYDFFFCCLQSLVIYHISSEPFHLGFLIKHLFEIQLFLEPFMLMIVYCDFLVFQKISQKLTRTKLKPSSKPSPAYIVRGDLRASLVLSSPLNNLSRCPNDKYE